MSHGIGRAHSIPKTVTFSRVHDGVINWKHIPRYWPFVRGIHWWPVDSPRKGQWRGALMFSLIYAWTSGWANNGDDGDLGRHRAHYEVTAMIQTETTTFSGSKRNTDRKCVECAYPCSQLWKWHQTRTPATMYYIFVPFIFLIYIFFFPHNFISPYLHFFVTTRQSSTYKQSTSDSEVRKHDCISTLVTSYDNDS